ncbi:MAG TPA: dihydrofolate reductase family protein [Candidatus Agrococcus pullicola]|uniref:Dihydrofolate reductase family protein n=1 Tax=Candidatus Agrococcus pullicola TaxID=2838429 RepID=A0A9D1YSJ1_9MICO|nr:dihydrofolate reductase family protein [Candidatus Agrococcus pullicola]
MNEQETVGAFASLFPEDGAPVVRAVGITSVDGAAELDGRSGALGGPEDARLLSFLRRSADVILVGAATVEAEGYTYPLVEPVDAAWRVERGLAEQPPIALITRREEPDALGAMTSGASVPPRIFTTEPTASDRFAVDVVEDLQRSGSRRILVEGGPNVWGNLLEHGVLDEFSLTISPLLNPGGRKFTEQVTGVTDLLVLGHIGVGGFVMIRFAVP